MTRAFLYVGCILALSACTQRMICPAYQSAFIHDQSQLSKRFSYFENDSTPKYLTVSKNRYLVIPEQSYRKKLRTLQTVPMKSIHAVVPDSLKSNKPDSSLVAKDSTHVGKDSTKVTAAVDSSYQITIDKEVRVLRYYMDSSKYYVQDVKYTLDQDMYMWVFRDILVLPDVQAALMANKGKGSGPAGKGTNGKKEKKKFSFKNLFKKKQKDSTSVSPVVSGAEGVVDSTSTKPKEKKAFSLFKKKKTNVEATPTKKPDPAEKKDDGF